MEASRPFLGLLLRAFAAEGRRVPPRVLLGEPPSPVDDPTLPRARFASLSSGSEDRTPNHRRGRVPSSSPGLFVDPLSEAADVPPLQAFPVDVGQLASDQLEPTRSYASLHDGGLGHGAP